MESKKLKVSFFNNTPIKYNIALYRINTYSYVFYRDRRLCDVNGKGRGKQLKFFKFHE